MAPVKQRKLQKLLQGCANKDMRLSVPANLAVLRPLKEFVSWFWMRNWLSAIRRKLFFIWQQGLTI